MSEVKLHLRYPDSKPEDITDAYMRGVEVGRTLGRGECRKLPASGDATCIVRCLGRYEIEFGYWKCSNCGVECFEGAKYCMNCGAKVVTE